MAEPAGRIAALAHLDLAHRPMQPDAPLRLGERPFTSKVELRGRAEVATLAGTALGFELPREVGATSFGEGAHVLMLGPDQWWVTAEPGFEQAIVDVLEDALAQVPHAVVDISERLTVLWIEGAPAGAVLAAGCPLDLHPRSFRPGRCASSHLGKVPVTIHYVAGNEARPFFDLYVNRTFAEYAWRFLELAAREHGYTIIP